MNDARAIAVLLAIAAASAAPHAFAQAYPSELIRIIVPTSPPRLAADGGEVVASTPEAFAAYLRAETEKWQKVVEAAGIKPE